MVFNPTCPSMTAMRCLNDIDSINNVRWNLGDASISGSISGRKHSQAAELELLYSTTELLCIYSR